MTTLFVRAYQPNDISRLPEPFFPRFIKALLSFRLGCELGGNKEIESGPNNVSLRRVVMSGAKISQKSLPGLAQSQPCPL